MAREPDYLSLYQPRASRRGACLDALSVASRQRPPAPAASAVPRPPGAPVFPAPMFETPRAAAVQAPVVLAWPLPREAQKGG